MIDNTTFNNKTAAYYTLGCKLNFAETSYIGKQLSDAGFRKASSNEKAQLCIINTCSVTEIADKKCRQTIRKAKQQHPDAFVIVTGCYAQLKPEEIAGIEGVDLVLGNKEKFNIEDYLHVADSEKRIVAEKISHAQSPTFHPACSCEDRTRYFLKVQDGCDYFCSYCTIPLARGRSRNGSIAEITQITKEAILAGAKEIVLSGVNIGDFGKSTNETFFDLVKTLDLLEGIERYRISSIEPNLLTDEIIDYIAVSRKFAPHFHIPLQSGCNEVLSLMKRRYNRELFAHKVAYIKEKILNAFIGIDVIVGTPGETQAYFEDTVRFLQSIDFSQLHVFTYSERPNTQALQIEYKVPAFEKNKRSTMLHDLSNQKLIDFYSSHIGNKAAVLWEEQQKNGTMFGFTGNYIRVSAAYDKQKVNTVETIILGAFDNATHTLKAVYI